MESIWQDLRFGARALLKNPGFALVAILTLTLGIGVNSAIFSVVNSVLIQPLGVRAQGELVRVYFSSPSFRFRSFSYPDYRDVRDANSAFEGFVAYRPTPMSLSFEGRNEKVWGIIATGNYFEVLGVAPFMGRLLTPADDLAPGNHPVAVLSHKAWTTRFGADPDVVGAVLNINGHPFTVVGVAAPDFGGTERFVGAELWAPMMMQAQIVPGENRLEARGHGWLQTIARLRAGASVEQASAASQPVARRLVEEHGGSAETGLFLVPVDEALIAPQIQSDLELSSVLLLAVVGVVLLVACANLANLLLARAETRRREMGLRLALGAGGARLIRQLLTESLLLAIAGGAGGVLLAFWATRALVGLIPPLDLPVAFDFQPDGRVLAFTFALSVVTGLIFGLMPALRASRVDLVPALKRGPGGAPVKGTRRLGSLLIVGQVALSLVLLVTAGLFLRSLQNAAALKPGFNPERVLLATVDPALHGFSESETAELLSRLQDTAAGLPGVRAAALAEIVPLGIQGGGQQWGVSVEGYQPGPDENMSIDYNIVSAGYFETLEIPLLAGRTLTTTDTAASPAVIVINETMAGRFWPGESAVGRRVRMAGVEREVIGIVADIKHSSLGEDPLAYMYLPHSQFFNSAMTIHLRTKGDPLALAGALRGVVAQLNPTLPLFDVTTLDTRIRTALLPARLGATLLTTFGGLALLLAVVGLYGIVSYNVHRQTRDIGIRMALGASRPVVLGGIVRRGMLIVGAGLVLGLLAATGVTRLLTGFLYNVAPLDPVAFAAVTGLMVAIGLGATLLPALRASRVDPNRALRYE